MSTVKEMSEALSAAVAAVEGVRVYQDPGATIDPPGVVVGPPTLEWGSPSSEPTAATFLVYVLVAVSDRSLEQLWDLVPQVAAALDGVSDAAVTRADPGFYPTGQSNLPAYEITVEADI